MSDSSERRTTFSVSKALSGMSPKKSGFRATDLETGMSMVILKRTTNLLETLTASGHFGARVLGVRITNRLLAKGFAGLLGLYTLMQSLGMGGEERA